MYICIFSLISSLLSLLSSLFSRLSSLVSRLSSLFSRVGDGGDDGGDGGRFFQSIQAPSSTHPGISYPVRANPSLRCINIHLQCTLADTFVCFCYACHLPSHHIKEAAFGRLLMHISPIFLWNPYHPNHHKPKYKPDETSARPVCCHGSPI